MTPILETHDVTKRFPGVLANDRVSFSLKEGEILAFLGENGAGKSTLMNILYGLYAQDEGEIEVRGKPVDIQDPNDAIELGIGMVHQHFQLVPVFTVAENIVMGTEPTRFSFSWKTLGIASGVTALLAFLGAIFTFDNVGLWLAADHHLCQLFFRAVGRRRLTGYAAIAQDDHPVRNCHDLIESDNIWKSDDQRRGSSIDKAPPHPGLR